MSDVGRSRAVGDEQQTGWALLASGQTVQLARPIERLGARILDFLIVAIPPTAIWAIVRGRDAFVANDGETLTNLGEIVLAELGALLVLVLADFVYEVAPTARWGQTLGKRIVGIKVVDASTGAAPGLSKSLGRWAVLTLPIAVPYLRYGGVIFFLLCVLTMGHEPCYRGWHDKVARTLVVTSRRNDRGSGRPRPALPRYGRQS
ncbi:MAG: RDD family protein [Acidimicrobiaceae bacterium]|nr:RDD family protein [Acidimicrobiaceae bacterium]MDE0497374.1 RDD family protein [Acidimicrobiaceae bacterium]